MKRLLISIIVLLLGFLFHSSQTTWAVEPTILRNIANDSDGSNSNDFITMNDVAYFSADDGTSGNELWKTDGTGDGTSIVKDINSGSGSSSPGEFIQLGEFIYFSADDGINGRELWKTDGSAGGTMMVKDIYSGSSSSSPSSMAEMNNVLYFAADDGINGSELWKSDGSTGGTVLVRNIATIGGSNPSSLTSINDTLYFSAFFGGQGRELWKSDGTFEGTVLVKDIRPGSTGSEPGQFKSNGVILFFKANDGTNGSELWKSDGSTGGTTLVKDINSGSNSSDPNPQGGIVMGSTLYFGASDGVSSNSSVLWKSDGTNEGTSLVKDVYFSSPILVGTTIYFGGDDGILGTELWRSDGTSDGTLIVKDINSGSNGSDSYGFVILGDTLYFQAYTDDYGYELWESDGTENTTALVKDIYVGSSDSNPRNFTVLSDYLVFTAEDETYGEEPWVLDLSDADPPSLSVTDASPNPTIDTTPTLTGSTIDTVSNIAYVQFQVGGTSGSWSSCSASDGTYDELSEAFTCTITALSEGTHTVYFRSADSNGNISENELESVTIDTTGPSINLNSLSPNTTSDTTPTFSGTVNDSYSTLFAVQFQIDGTSGSWSSCSASDGTYDELSETFTCSSLAIEDGDHTVYVRGTDGLGNITSTGSYGSESFTIDSTPSNLSAIFPSEGLYLRQQRPTFKFRASTGSVSQFASYTLTVENIDGTGFSINNIPVNAPSVTTSRYTITSSGYGDANDENDFIYVTTLSSTSWDSRSNNGRLKEGKNTWTMIARESNGNNVSVGHTFYVDITKPNMSGIFTSALGQYEGYLLSTQTRPKVDFTFSDNLFPYRYTVDIYKQNYVLAVETGRSIISSESIIPELKDGQLLIDLSYTPQQSLPYGKYLIVLTGYDKAGNSSTVSSLSVQLLSKDKAEELLKKPVKEVRTLSLPELEKKAILRRQKEAQILYEFIHDIKETFNAVDSRLVTSAQYVYRPINFVAAATQKTLGIFVQGLDDGLSTLMRMAHIPKFSASSRSPLEERIVDLRKNVQTEDQGLDIKPTLTTQDVQLKFKRQYAPSSKKIDGVFSALSTTFRGFEKPVHSASGFASRVSMGAQTFYAIVFDKKPTVISDVTIEEVGIDYVVVSWKTNHPATGKVNYGKTLSYGNEVHLSEYEKMHTAKLKGLKPGEIYFFEVMSHGKNYTYDAFYTVETLIEEKE